MNGTDTSNFYGRMFPPTGFPVDPLQEEDLRCLGKMMRDIGVAHGETADAGLTYFGQFIDHDLTYDVTPLGARNVEPTKIRNFRTPRLDLELIYGGGPERSPDLYEADGLRLRVGKTLPGLNGAEGGTPRDIGRYDNGAPCHADPNDTRNLENLLVMQIHVLFLRFHNEAVEQCAGAAFNNQGLPDDTFKRAQQLVRWHYQWLVREIFLPAVVHGPTLRDIVWDGRKPKIRWHDDGLFIPAEFSLTAFRFGHSMVRAEYRVNCRHPTVQLADLMTDGNPPRLSEDQLFEWGMLFRNLVVSGSRHIPSERINTGIAEPLHHLPEYTKRLFSDESAEPQPKQLPARTLLRGARAALPTGQEVAKSLIAQGILEPGQMLTPDQLMAAVPGVTTNDSGSMLRGSWMLDNTPLYYYILKEAEVLGGDNFTLGPVGSLIVAETIERVLWQDEESYVRMQGPEWTPPTIWKFKDGGAIGRITSFQALIQMLGDKLPNGCSPAIASQARAFWARFSRRLGMVVRTIGF